MNNQGRRGELETVKEIVDYVLFRRYYRSYFMSRKELTRTLISGLGLTRRSIDRALKLLIELKILKMRDSMLFPQGYSTLDYGDHVEIAQGNKEALDIDIAMVFKLRRDALIRHHQNDIAELPGPLREELADKFSESSRIMFHKEYERLETRDEYISKHVKTFGMHNQETTNVIIHRIKLEKQQVMDCLKEYH